MAADPTHVVDEWDGSGPEPAVTILVYSDDAGVRENVRRAVGRRAAKDLPEIDWLETATDTAVIDAVDAGRPDLLILDGEAGKAGGMGLCRQIKNEIFEAPPVLLLTGRAADAWLASWSEADAVVSHPLDPIVVSGAVADLVRAVVAGR